MSAYGYTNDVTGRRSAISRNGSVFTTPDALSYSYNDRSEVTEASSDEDANYSYLYSFDNIGNRISASQGGTPYSYTTNNLNQYTAVNSNSPTYDDDGNMLSYDGWTLTWNAENRLIKMEKGSAKLEFDYDYMGRRIFKKVYSGSTLTSHVRFVYQGYKLIQELDALDDNSILKQYVWQSVGLDVPVAVYDTVNDETYYYHSDANKNITEISDSNGNIVAHYEYSPFGILTKSTGTYADTNPFRFSSEYFDNETGLVYYNYRYYSTELGRWLSKDPIAEQGGVNLYTFLSNSAVIRYDSLGLECCDECSEGDYRIYPSPIGLSLNINDSKTQKNIDNLANKAGWALFAIGLLSGATPSGSSAQSIATSGADIASSSGTQGLDPESLNNVKAAKEALEDFFASLPIDSAGNKGVVISITFKYETCAQKRCILKFWKKKWYKQEKTKTKECNMYNVMGKLNLSELDGLENAIANRIQLSKITPAIIKECIKDTLMQVIEEVEKEHRVTKP